MRKFPGPLQEQCFEFRLDDDRDRMKTIHCAKGVEAPKGDGITVECKACAAEVNHQAKTLVERNMVERVESN